MYDSKSDPSSGRCPPPHSNDSFAIGAYFYGTEAEVTSRFESRITRLARNYAPGNSPLQQDLAQEGFIGLVNAQRNFRPGRGASFVTYADRHIRGRMKNYIRSESRHNCCIPLDQCYGTEADGDGGSDQSPQLLAHQIIEAVDQFLFTVEGRLLREFLSCTVGIFTQRQQLIFRLRFLHGLTVGEIAQEIAVSPARVSQVLADAIKKLHAALIRN